MELCLQGRVRRAVPAELVPVVIPVARGLRVVPHRGLVVHFPGEPQGTAALVALGALVALVGVVVLGAFCHFRAQAPLAFFPVVGAALLAAGPGETVLRVGTAARVAASFLGAAGLLVAQAL